MNILPRLQACKRPSGGGFQVRKVVSDSMPDDVCVDPIVPIPEPISHASNIGPRLIRYQFRRAVAEPMGGFADAFQATLDGVARLAVSGKGRAIRNGDVIRDSFGVLDDVRERLDRIMFRRQPGAPGRCWPEVAVSPQVLVQDPPDDRAIRPDGVRARSTRINRCRRPDRVRPQGQHRYRLAPPPGRATRTKTDAGCPRPSIRFDAPAG